MVVVVVVVVVVRQGISDAGVFMSNNESTVASYTHTSTHHHLHIFHIQPGNPRTDAINFLHHTILYTARPFFFTTPEKNKGYKRKQSSLVSPNYTVTAHTSAFSVSASPHNTKKLSVFAGVS
ncbi:hypothetical protein E2C01_043269 [Portunus trituberculatus]|uniref:Secreted protein n=1 Tax=Portunus trituberculatus TaxID=210409 RepID=A0A5B7FVM7_PORTR|nr:hypothetical protein [Portunus trituberculatus]